MENNDNNIAALPRKEWLLIKEVAPYWRVGEKTVRNWLKGGKMSYTKKVGGIRISREDALNGPQ